LNDILDAASRNTIETGASFSVRHRGYRVLWSLVWLILAAWTPPIFHPWRRVLLRLFGAKVSATAGIYSSARIWYPANLRMAPYAFIGPRALVYSMGPIELGAYALVSQGAHLCAGTHDIEDPNFQLCAGSIKIGERAWVAAEAFVGPGVTMGEGSVLGARGVAFGDLEPWTVYAGNPARPLKKRVLRTGPVPAAS